MEITSLQTAMGDRQAELRALMKSMKGSSGSRSSKKTSSMSRMRKSKSSQKRAAPAPAAAAFAPPSLPQRAMGRGAMAPPSKPNLPAGFFDDKPSAPSTTSATSAASLSRAGPLVRLSLEQSSNPPAARVPPLGQSVPRPNMNAASIASTTIDTISTSATSSLPVGFFDDEAKDAKARNVSLAAEKEEAQANEWANFSAFAAEVVDEEHRDKKVEEDDRTANDMNETVDHSHYATRFISLVQQSLGDSVAGESGQASSSPNNGPGMGGSSSTKRRGPAAVGSSSDDEDDDPLKDMAVMLKRRRVARKVAAEDATKGAFVPLDPSDWRMTGVRGAGGAPLSLA